MNALKTAPSPFTAGVLAGALVCLVAGAPWPLVGCLILAGAAHARDVFAEPGINARIGQQVSEVFKSGTMELSPEDEAVVRDVAAASGASLEYARDVVAESRRRVSSFEDLREAVKHLPKSEHPAHDTVAN